MRIITKKLLRSNKCVNLYGINIDDRQKKEKEDDDVIITIRTNTTQWVQMRVMIKHDRSIDGSI